MASKRKRGDEDQGVHETDMMQTEDEEPISPRSKAQRGLTSHSVDSVSDPSTAPSAPVIDGFTRSIGAGWTFITSLHDSKQQAARGIATFIQKQCPLNGVQILAEHIWREEYFCVAEDGYYLFENQTNRLRLLSKDFEVAKRNLGQIPYVFEGEGWRSFSGYERSTSSSSPGVLSESDEIDVAHKLANPNDPAHHSSPTSTPASTDTPLTSNPSATISSTWGPSGFPNFPSAATHTHVTNMNTTSPIATQALGTTLHSQLTASVVDMITDQANGPAIGPDGGQHASDVTPANSLMTHEGAEGMDMS